jgi:hypothetical protein
MMITKFRKPALAFLVALFLSFFLTSPAMAAMVSSLTSSHQTDGTYLRDMDIDKIQFSLENKIVQDKLCAYGFTAEEIKSKLQSMTDKQIHMLAQASDDVLSGGDGLGVVIAVLIIILLVIVIMKLLDKKIIIK